MFKIIFKNSPRCFYSQIPNDKEDLADFRKFKMTQKRFQRRDNLPVFLKGGPIDKILFVATIGFTVLGFIHTVRFLYNMSYPSSLSKMEEREK